MGPPCINNDTQEKEIKTKTIPFVIAIERIKYQVINLTEYVKDLNTENYKTLFKRLKKT